MDALTPLMDRLLKVSGTAASTDDVFAVGFLQYRELAIAVHHNTALLALKDLRPQPCHKFVTETAKVKAPSLTVFPLMLRRDKLSALKDVFDG